MKKIFQIIFIGLFLFGVSINAHAEQAENSKGFDNETKDKADKPKRDIELNTLLMQSTFMLAGQSKEEKDKIKFGTGFIIGRSQKNNPGKSKYVLITAAHVFEDFRGPKATIFLRTQKEDGSYEKTPYEFMIFDESNKPLWVRHPDKEIDVAAMYIAIPKKAKFSLIPTKLLCDDINLEKFEIHPGDELFCLGYPLGVQSQLGGFPILRSGKIASYPLIPIKTVKKFYFDFQVYDGNSGGPVYFIQTSRYYDGKIHFGETIHFIAGLVSAQAGSKLYNNQPVYLAEIIPSPFILETVNLLPE